MDCFRSAALAACICAYTVNSPLAQTAVNPAAIDRISQFATLIGHGSACGMLTSDKENLVLAWIDAHFPEGDDNSLTRGLLTSIRKTEEQRQIDGETLDSCNEIFRLFEKAQWPRSTVRPELTSS